MSDLYKLLSDRQDELRGRPRNWRDDLSDWNGRQDWQDNVFRTLLVLGLAMTLVPVVAIGAIMVFG